VVEASSSPPPLRPWGRDSAKPWECQFQLLCVCGWVWMVGWVGGSERKMMMETNMTCNWCQDLLKHSLPWNCWNHPVSCTALARLLNRTYKFGIGTVLSETHSFIWTVKCRFKKKNWFCTQALM
jgi:hypothetical protein